MTEFKGTGKTPVMIEDNGKGRVIWTVFCTNAMLQSAEEHIHSLVPDNNDFTVASIMSGHPNFELAQTRMSQWLEAHTGMKHPVIGGNEVVRIVGFRRLEPKGHSVVSFYLDPGFEPNARRLKILLVHYGGALSDEQRQFMSEQDWFSRVSWRDESALVPRDQLKGLLGGLLVPPPKKYAQFRIVPTHYARVIPICEIPTGTLLLMDASWRPTDYLAVAAAINTGAVGLDYFGGGYTLDDYGVNGKDSSFAVGLFPLEDM